MRYLLLILIVLLCSCSLFTPQDPPTPDDSIGSDPLNLKKLLNHPSESFDFTLYSELLEERPDFFTDDNKSSYKSSSDFIKRLEFIKNSPHYSSIKVTWSGMPAKVLSKDGSENDLPERFCTIYLESDTLIETCLCKVRYDRSTDRWQLTKWEVIKKDGTYSFFNAEYSD